MPSAANEEESVARARATNDFSLQDYLNQDEGFNLTFEEESELHIESLEHRESDYEKYHEVLPPSPADVLAQRMNLALLP